MDWWKAPGWASYALGPLPPGAASPGDPQISTTDGFTAILMFSGCLPLSRRLDEMLTLSLKEILQFFVANAAVIVMVVRETGDRVMLNSEFPGDLSNRYIFFFESLVKLKRINKTHIYNFTLCRN